jgi:hypothetical protein
MLSAAALASMRATQAVALPLTCSISRRATVPDGMGGSTESWPVLASGVACRLSLLGNPAEVVVLDQFIGRELWQLTLPAGQDVAHLDVVTLGGEVYQVVGVNSGGVWETARRVVLTRGS